MKYKPKRKNETALKRFLNEKKERVQKEKKVIKK
tara:strand:+ start:17 stop:118 length:102 start_codon:yes stop_codon:yes gene_type:complete